MQQSQYGKYLSSESKPFSTQEPNQPPGNKGTKPFEETKVTGEKKKLKISSKDFSATTLNNVLSFIPVTAQKKQQQPQPQQQPLQPSGDEPKKKKKKKSKKSSAAKKEADNLWNSLGKDLDNQWTKPIYTRNRDKNAKPPSNSNNANSKVSFSSILRLIGLSGGRLGGEKGGRSWEEQQERNKRRRRKCASQSS